MVGLFIWSILMIFIGVCVGYVIGLIAERKPKKESEGCNNDPME